MSKRKQQQISFDSLDSAVAQTLKHYVPAVEFAWDTYAPHEQSAFVEWARRIDAGEQAGRWSDALAAANAQHRAARPIPEAAPEIRPNVSDQATDWTKKDPQLHAAIDAASHKLRRHCRDDGYVVCDSVIVPHVLVRGSKKGDKIKQPFGLMYSKDHLGPREFTMMITLLTILVERNEGNDLVTYPMELRLNQRRDYNNRDVNDSLWAAITKLCDAGYLANAEKINNKRWRITFDRNMLIDWLRDETEDHAYQCVDAAEFYKRLRTPTKQWLFCAYGTEFVYSGKDEETVRAASGSRATLPNFRRALRQLFRRQLTVAVEAQQQQQETLDQTTKTAVLAEVKQRITKTAAAIWTRGRISNSGINWTLDTGHWRSAIANAAEIIGQAVEAVAERLLGAAAEPIPAD